MRQGLGTAFVLGMMMLMGCKTGLPVYSQCDSTQTCGYPANRCYDIGGAGQCTLTCNYDSDCPNAGGFAGTCRPLAAYPDSAPVCFQSCYYDSDCHESGTACSGGVCVPAVATVVTTGTLYPYEICGATTDCDTTYSNVCAAVDNTPTHNICSVACTMDTPGMCPGRGNVPGVCRTLPSLPSNASPICFLSCVGGTSCPSGTTCNGDICYPNP